jgi:hypothetical protein
MISWIVYLAIVITQCIMLQAGGYKGTGWKYWLGLGLVLGAYLVGVYDGRHP